MPCVRPNLGINRWGSGPGEAPGSSIVEEPDASRCLVVDLGSLPSREEETLAAIAVLGDSGAPARRGVRCWW